MSERADRLALRVLACRALHPAVLSADRAGAVINPDLVVLVDGDAADVPDHPMVRQWLRPCGVEHESGGRTFFLNRHPLSEALRNPSLLQSFGRGLLCAHRCNEAYARHAGQRPRPNNILENS